MIKDTEAAFHWIIDILTKAKIPYRISGGFAARVYRSQRPLADIDIEVDDHYVNIVAELAKSYVIYGPSQYKDEQWDLQLATLSYMGQEIDIAGASANIFNLQSNSWETLAGNLDDSEIHEVYGRLVPIEPLSSLLAYKSRISREVDLLDVAELELLHPK